MPSALRRATKLAAAHSLRAARRCVPGALVVLCVLACAPEAPRVVDPTDIPIADADVLVHVRREPYGLGPDNFWECWIARDGRFRVVADWPERGQFLKSGGRTARSVDQLVDELQRLGFFELSTEELLVPIRARLGSYHCGVYLCEVRRDGALHSVELGYVAGFETELNDEPLVARAVACWRLIHEYLDHCCRM